MQATTTRPAQRRVDVPRWMTDILFGWTETALTLTTSNTLPMVDVAAVLLGLRILSRALVKTSTLEEMSGPCSGYAHRLLKLW